ncbi:universal stress protein [Natronococcus sp.]|uniref:universal stress protein n=1 Tax=Natronococcus sp. TaxID=35747 RepID=UPI003A4D4932
MYRSILVATDDSPPAKLAIDRAITIADRFDASLHVLYVIDQRLGRTTATKDPYKRIGTEALHTAEQDATERDVRTTTSLVEGDPEDAILEYAADHGVDLIVLGGKSKSTAERFFIGTTAEKVVRHAGVSTLVVREDD